MQIIDIGDTRFQVIREISGNEESAKKYRSIYEINYPDFKLIKKNKRVDSYSSYLLCREIENADFKDIVEDKEKKIELGKVRIEGSDKEDD